MIEKHELYNLKQKTKDWEARFSFLVEVVEFVLLNL
jgi:hypothetical protein